MKSAIVSDGKEIMLNYFVEEFVANVVMGVARGLHAYEDGADIEIELGESVKMTAGGEDVKMVPFVERIVKGILVGMLKELNGYRDGDETKISVIQGGAQ